MTDDIRILMARRARIGGNDLLVGSLGGSFNAAFLITSRNCVVHLDGRE